MRSGAAKTLPALPKKQLTMGKNTRMLYEFRILLNLNKNLERIAIMAKKKSTYSLPVRIMALALTFLVASGVLTYLVMFFMSLFS